MSYTEFKSETRFVKFLCCFVKFYKEKMSKINVNNDFDYVLLNAQLLRRCSRLNILQLVIFVIALVSVFYMGRHSNNCDFNGEYYQSFVSENFTNLQSGENQTGMYESTTKSFVIPNEEYLDILR